MKQEIQTILAVGSIAIDTLETPSGNKNNILGGSASYFSLAASLLAPVKLVGVVGTDFPDVGWSLFKSHNINIDNVQILKGKTFRWGGRYNNDYSRRDTLFTELGVFESFDPLIQKADCASPLVFLGNIHPDLQLGVLRLCKSTKYIVSDTMNLWIDNCYNGLKEVLKNSQIFILNHEEAQQLTGTNNLPEAAMMLRSDGPNIVIIKRGAMGAYLSYGNVEHYVPAFPVEQVIDPTGAGDSFAGGFVGCLSRFNSQDFLKAAIFGAAMASFCVESFGVDSLVRVNMSALEERVSIIRKIMRDSENN